MAEEVAEGDFESLLLLAGDKVLVDSVAGVGEGSAHIGINLDASIECRNIN